MKSIKHLPVSTRPASGHNVYSDNSLNKHNILWSGDCQNLRLTPDNTPLNTGKVLIGSAYQPKPCQVSEDQQWLQDALLKDKRKSDLIPMNLADKVMYCLGVLALVVVWFTR